MKLAPIFNHHTVLQANKPIRIYGSGKGHAKVSFDGETHEILSTGDLWCLIFSPRPYGGPYELSVTLDGVTSVYTDLFVGEVLLLSGQSNMGYKLYKTPFPTECYEENPRLRYFAAERFASEDRFSPADGWVFCTKETAAFFSAIGYHLGMLLSNEKKIAVGLLACYLGSSKIESWLPREIALREEFYLPPEEKLDAPYAGKIRDHNTPGKLYGIRQQSLVPFSIGRVIWYQGESNTGRGEPRIYTRLLEALITRWRKDFMDDDLPFTVIQIADWDARDDDAWHGIQAAQEKIVEILPHVTLIRSADVCEKNDVHPPTKTLLAERIWKSLTK